MEEEYLTVVRLVTHKYFYTSIYAYVHTNESKNRCTIYCKILRVILKNLQRLP